MVTSVKFAPNSRLIEDSFALRLGLGLHVVRARSEPPLPRPLILDHPRLLLQPRRLGPAPLRQRSEVLQFPVEPHAELDKFAQQRQFLPIGPRPLKPTQEKGRRGGGELTPSNGVPMSLGSAMKTK